MSTEPKNESQDIEKEQVTENVELSAAADDDQDNAQNASENAQELDLSTLQAELETAQTKASENWDLLLRERAEAQNIQRRADREVSNAKKYAVERICNDLLPVLDSLEQGLSLPASSDESKAVLEGVELTVKMMVDVLHKHNVKQLNPVGENFNPEHHEAMAMQESAEHEANTIINVFQKGYLLNGRLIRPARVVVSKGSGSQVDTHA
ncbi:MAG: nucleotide exchange factor GrpE [Pseudomonadota bacterium]